LRRFWFVGYHLPQAQPEEVIMANQLKMATLDAILSLHQRDWSIRRIAKELGIHRDTVARQIRLWEQQAKPASSAGGAQEAKPATLEEAPIGSKQASAEGAPIGVPTPRADRKATPSLCEPWRAVIVAKREAGLTAQRIFQDLVGEHGFGGKYPSVRRFVWRLEQSQPLPFRRMECAPGEEAQVDFGTGIPITQPDGTRRRTHVFRIVLSHSRKGYSEAVYRQTTEAFLGCLENAFAHFGGAPRVLVPDNLKAGVIVPDWFDPELNPKLRAFGAHYGVAIVPTRPRTPRHKGKIESGIGYVKKNALQGRVFTSLEDENRHLLQWETTVADLRIHGTIRQQVAQVFAAVERPALQPLPLERFPFFHEGRRIVHRDGHVEVAKAYYTVPPEYLTRTVWVRWDARLVRIFNARWEQIALHSRQAPGRFSTQGQHLPAAKISGVERGAAWLLSQVRRLGPHAGRWGESVIATRGVEGVRVLQGLLSLARRHPVAALEQACEVAASCQAYRLRTLRELLKRQGAKQEQFAFMDEHPVIRRLEEYADLVRAVLHKEVGP
jgi:transposase